VEFLQLHGFEIESLKCSGYPPLAGSLADLLAKLDKTHSRYIMARIRKRQNME
jgi:hypothetical protein